MHDDNSADVLLSLANIECISLLGNGNEEASRCYPVRRGIKAVIDGMENTTERINPVKIQCRNTSAETTDTKPLFAPACCKT